jgi:hypothetical protein
VEEANSMSHRRYQAMGESVGRTVASLPSSTLAPVPEPASAVAEPSPRANAYEPVVEKACIEYYYFF